MLTSFYGISRGTFRLNWGVPFLSLGILACAELLSQTQVKKLRNWSFGFLLVSMVPILTVFYLDQNGQKPLDRFLDQASIAQVDLEMDMADQSLIDAIRPLAEGRVAATSLYGMSALLQNYGFDEVTVFSASVFGRNDDIFTDFRQYDGRDFIHIPADAKNEAPVLAQFFTNIEIINIAANRQTHSVFVLEGFNFESYRQQMILPVLAKFYDQSSFPAGRCYMDKYR
ncbi:MAG: hypothetical protein L3J33_06060 [Rhodobacteraceae bacterium]|nr:hypothetical protein [Paracoccaceae bacterium]